MGIKAFTCMDELRAQNEALQEENRLLSRTLQNVLPLASAAEEELERRYRVKTGAAGAEANDRRVSKSKYDLVLKKLNTFLDKIDFLETVRSDLEADIFELVRTKGQLESDMRRDIVMLEDHIRRLESEIQVLESADPRQDVVVDVAVREARRRVQNAQAMKHPVAEQRDDKRRSAARRDARAAHGRTHRVASGSS